MNETTPRYRKQLDHYLDRLENELAALPGSDRREIVAETRSHFLERLSEDADDEEFRRVADGLGPPPEYARRFRDNYEIDRALASGSAWLMLRKSATLLRRGIADFFLVGGLLLLAVATAGFAALAAIKPLFPDNVGLWGRTDGFMLNFAYLEPGPQHVELLGGWFIPVAVILALISFAALRKSLPAYLRWVRNR